ncbi:MAG: nitroreductase family deazaflavin-dependent oxidoreductase [Nitrososphaerota archaeon]|nr:nitroreductase family deazaflavin-dependent oxidoreductase [Nitrososphaerota archaeon]MDG6941874.1 nitroreductase family deazaflavin-dependent oxidoreductase [Nitrososphaerota archaeon]MDG6946953.1 nitroreductase family deazaflavin-dependent oxidoreductase [Nitrososphaerota archaeon]MDG6950635.1 nitroreductase family deazaflavin-dependent oxidoreductase [Nitrososphaerota archaeon]
MSSPNDWNAGVIAEFRRNHGKVGGNFEGAPILLIHHKGAKTGKARVNPVMYLKDEGRYLVFASKGGAETNPDWYHNLMARHEAEIEVGDEKFSVSVREVKGEERDVIYARQSSLYPQFAEYQRKTKRKIPVVELRPK